MSVTKARKSDLQIDLAAPKGWTFAAGDTVIGTLVRREPIVAGEATVRLFLAGSLKSSFIRYEHNTGYFDNRNRFEPHGRSPVGSDSLNPDIHKSARGPGYLRLIKPTRHVLFQGPLHIPKEGEPLTIPFELEVPSSSESSLRHPSSRGNSPPHTDSAFIDHLPGTFISAGGSGSSSSTARIEYYLEAELQYDHGGKEHTLISICPLILRHPTHTVFEGFGLQQWTMKRTVESHRFIPGMEKSELSFKQRTNMLFGFMRVPELKYKVDVSVPATIQLNNPSIIPLKLEFAQLDTTTPSIRNNPHMLRLNWVKLFVRACTRVDAFSPFPTTQPRGGTHWTTHDLGLEKACEGLASFPLQVSLSEKSQPVDLGNMLQLALYTNGLKSKGRHLAWTTPIAPNFAAYTVRQTNWLDLELSVTVVDQIRTLKSSTELTLLALN